MTDRTALSAARVPPTAPYVFVLVAPAGEVREAVPPPRDPAGSLPADELERTIERLEALSRRLGLMMAVVQVCFAALRQQDADSDREIAQVLQRYVGDTLAMEMEQLGSLSRRLQRASRRAQAD